MRGCFLRPHLLFFAFLVLLLFWSLSLFRWSQVFLRPLLWRMLRAECLPAISLRSFRLLSRSSASLPGPLSTCHLFRGRATWDRPFYLRTPSFMSPRSCLSMRFLLLSCSTVLQRYPCLHLPWVLPTLVCFTLPYPGPLFNGTFPRSVQASPTI